MANEVTISSSLNISNGNLRYRTSRLSFTGDMDGEGGPSPGAIIVPTTGTDVDFTELVTPGYCELTNYDDTNFVEWGIHDGTLFHPIGQILPGETYIIRLSPSLGREEVAVGTGSTNPPNTFFLKADTASCIVFVGAFDA